MLTIDECTEFIKALQAIISLDGINNRDRATLKNLREHLIVHRESIPVENRTLEKQRANIKNYFKVQAILKKQAQNSIERLIRDFGIIEEYIDKEKFE